MANGTGMSAPTGWIMIVLTILLMIGSFVATVLISYRWLDSRFDAIEANQQSFGFQLQSLDGVMWSRSDQAYWAAELAKENGEVYVPRVLTDDERRKDSSGSRGGRR